MKKKTKLYTTYGKLYYKGKPDGRKYPVKIEATSKAEAIRKAKKYHAEWNKGAKKRKDDKGYAAKYVGIKIPKKRKKRTSFNSLYFGC